MIMGLGTALFEAIDVRRRPGDEREPLRLPVPVVRRPAGRLTHELIEREGAEVHGLGETALPPVPAAIGNALASLGIDVDGAAAHRRARARGGCARGTAA